MKSLSELKVELAQAQCIYEPKYGGKDRSGYEKLMKYEVNDEREEAFEKGFDAGSKAVIERAEVLTCELNEILRATKQLAGRTEMTRQDIYHIQDVATKALLDWANFVKEK